MLGVQYGVCRCFCHCGSVADRWGGGVAVIDVIEAAVACKRCENKYCAALLSRKLPNDAERIRPDPTAWADALPLPPTNADGEGVE